MNRILLLIALTSLAQAQMINLRKIAYLSRGACGSYTRVKVFDANHNGKNDVIFQGTWSEEGIGAVGRVLFYENTALDKYDLRDSIYVCTCPSFYDIGYLDNDSLTDAVVQCNLGGVTSYAVVFESRDYYSYPTQIVWQWRYEINGGGVSPSFIADLDRDGRVDLLTVDNPVLYVFECTGDNQYQKVWWDTLQPEGAYLAAIGDYDQDNRSEFVMGTPSGFVIVYECSGDNQYREVFRDTLDTYGNFQDLWSGNDLDSDGKPEFLIASFRWPYGYHLFVYEAVGNDRYDYVLVDSIVSLEESKFKANGHSSCGDVDGDGKDEIVWAIADRFSVYKAMGNNQYQMMYRSPRKRYTSTHAVAYDVNKNGYAEIIESAWIDSPYVRTETTIWEIEGVRLHRPNGGEILPPGSQFPITWEKFSPPGADSFTLFVSFNNGVDYRTITTIRQSDDTLYAWSVPDTLADSVKLMIWAYGPPRAGQDVPRGTAWDFSDSCFAIRQTAVGEEAMGNRQWAGLQIRQNPTRKALGVRQGAGGNGQEVKLRIYDISGKMVKELGKVPAERWVTVELNPGVYFVRLETDGKAATQKVVIVR